MPSRTDSESFREPLPKPRMRHLQIHVDTCYMICVSNSINQDHLVERLSVFAPLHIFLENKYIKIQYAHV